MALPGTDGFGGHVIATVKDFYNGSPPSADFPPRSLLSTLQRTFIPSRVQMKYNHNILSGSLPGGVAARDLATSSSAEAGTFSATFTRAVFSGAARKASLTWAPHAS